MSPKSWFGRWRQRRRNRSAAEQTRRSAPLREFVYLDAVSLHSLLVSQNATIPSEVSQAISRADEAELSGTLGTQLGSDVLGASTKAESSARYKTSNSNSMQSSRKAVIQTLFKELRELPLEFKLAPNGEPPKVLRDLASVSTFRDPRSVESVDEFVRGTLVEVEVTLAVDPVFKLGAMMNEWTAMAGDYPAMFGNQGTLGFLHEAEPIMRVLDRFLAGLIPIKATATSHGVVEIGDREYIVHRAAIGDLAVPVRPLKIVGVTEHVGYWRDIRRVLFSAARFTMLCRVARDGIHEKWTPVKLADLFSDVAPGFVDQINAIRSPSAADGNVTSPQSQREAFANALDAYKDSLVPTGGTWAAKSNGIYEDLKSRLKSGPIDASAQRQGFDQVRDLLTTTLAMEMPTAEADLAARQEARHRAGLELFPSLMMNPPSSTIGTPLKKEKSEERMLDVEVIAIYW